MPIAMLPFFTRAHLHTREMSYEFLTLLSVQCCKPAADITLGACAYVPLNDLTILLLHPPPPRKQTRRPRVYTHTVRLEAERGTSNIHTKSRQALFKRPQSKLNNVK